VKSRNSPEGSMGSDLTSVTSGAGPGRSGEHRVSTLAVTIRARRIRIVHRTLNYDLKNGKQLKLSDLFKPGAKYLQAISSYCIADLKKQANGKRIDSRRRFKRRGRRRRITELEHHEESVVWASTSTRTRLVLTPPVRSSVMVPYSNLKDLINPDGPIAQFAKFRGLIRESVAYGVSRTRAKTRQKHDRRARSRT
jgi:hypothetical protein